MEQSQLIRGNVALGVVTHAPEERIDGGGWDVGWLEPSSEFEAIRSHLEQEQQLLDLSVQAEEDSDQAKGARRAARLLDLAGALQREIMQPGVWLVSLEDGRRVDVGELHIEAGKVFWR